MPPFLRPDDRPLFPPVHRPVSLLLRHLARHDGSAQLTVGSTSASAGAVGPVAPRSVRHEERGPGAPPAVTVSLRGLRDAADREAEAWIAGTLAGCALPPRRTGVAVGCRLAAEDGGGLACLLNACVAALVDAGVPLAYLPVGVALGRRGGTWQVDPDGKEEEGCDLVLTAAVRAPPRGGGLTDWSREDCVLSTFVTYPGGEKGEDGEIPVFPSPEEYVKACVLAVEASTVLTNLYRKAIDERLEEEAKTFRAK